MTGRVTMTLYERQIKYHCRSNDTNLESWTLNLKYRKNAHRLTFPLLVNGEEKKECVFCFKSEELHPSAISLSDRDRWNVRWCVRAHGNVCVCVYIKSREHPTFDGDTFIKNCLLCVHILFSLLFMFGGKDNTFFWVESGEWRIENKGNQTEC